MIKRQCWQIIHREPADLTSVISGVWMKLAIIYQGEIGDRNHAGARIAVRIAKGIELLHIEVTQPRLFFQFAARRRLQRLAHLDKSAGNGPVALKGPVAPLDKQRLQIAFLQTQDDHIHRYGWSLPLAGVIMMFGSLSSIVRWLSIIGPGSTLSLGNTCTHMAVPFSTRIRAYIV